VKYFFRSFIRAVHHRVEPVKFLLYLMCRLAFIKGWDFVLELCLILFSLSTHID